MDAINILLTIIILANLMLVSSSSMSRKNQNRVGEGLVYAIYLINILTIVWWLASMIFHRISGPETANFYAKNLYISATFIASSFYYFTLIFQGSKEFKNKYFKNLAVVFSLNILLVVAIIFGDSIIKGVDVNFTGENTTFLGSLYAIYVLYILYYFCTSFLRLFHKHLKTVDTDKKAQLLMLFSGYSIAGSIAFITNLILPFFGNFQFISYGPMASIFTTISITYAVKKHSLFDVKIIAAEFFVFAAWIFTVIRICTLDRSVYNFSEALLNVLFMDLIIIIGLLLIKSVKREAEHNTKNERLVLELASANKKLQEADELKNRFVSLATHHLASPVTAIKGYASFLKCDSGSDFGKNTKKDTQGWIGRIDSAMNKLTIIIRDFLDISLIERGDVSYSFCKFNLHEFIQEVASERDLLDSYNKSGTIQERNDSSCYLYADRSKIKQAVSNILENSIKYSNKCDIQIELITESSKYIIKISDHGERILPAISPVLLNKFSSSGSQTESDILGNGLGVYVAKKIIEGHSGKMSINFDKDQKMYCFQIELPVCSESVLLSKC